jgi:hypothetical protein
MNPVDNDRGTLTGAVVVHGNGTTVFGPIGPAVPATARMDLVRDTFAMPWQAMAAGRAMPSAEHASAERRPALRLAFGQGDRS